MSQLRRNVLYYCCVALLVIALTDMYGCRKRENTPFTVVLPTYLLDGEYLWHGKITAWIDSGYTIVDGTVADGIYVEDDTTIVMASDARENYAWGGPQVAYKYTSSNDTEVVYRKGLSTITFNFVTGMVKWAQDGTVLYGKAGASEKWRGVHDARLQRACNWHCRKKYYIPPAMKDTTAQLPDEYTDAFSLFTGLSHEERRALTFAGADSTGAFYYMFSFNAGPYKLTTPGAIRYYASGDSITMKYTVPGLYGDAYQCSSF